MATGPEHEEIREDFRKGSSTGKTRSLKCNPPNVKCGGRCIPPNWDCRQKGEGNDKHLRAAKTDPLSGAANIQRGFKRITKGVVTGNFSEVEGGKRAVVRGAVKLTPGTLKQKQELQRKLEQRAGVIGAGLAALTLGLGLHGMLMKQKGMYARGPGRRIEKATYDAFQSILDRTPGLAARRAKGRELAITSVGAAIRRQGASGPQELALRLKEGAAGAQIGVTGTRVPRSNDSATALDAAMQEFERNNGARMRSFDEWDSRNREAFWGARVNRTEKGFEGKTRSVFAEEASNSFLAQQFELTREQASPSRIQGAIASRLINERTNYERLAKQRGFRILANGRIHEDDQAPFLAQLRRQSDRRGLSDATREAVDQHLQKVLGRNMTDYSKEIISRTTDGFDVFYGQLESQIKQTPGAGLSATSRSRGTYELLAESDRARGSYLAQQLNVRAPQGRDSSELVRRAYFATRVAGSDTSGYSITDRVAQNAVQELTGQNVGPTQAFQILRGELGFSGAVPVRKSAATRGLAEAARAAERRPRQLLTEAQLIDRLMREGLSRKAATNAARKEIRERGDSSERVDFKGSSRLGKPCGESYIPKAHECRKGSKGATPESGEQKAKSGEIKKAAIATAVGAVGVMAVAVALDVRAAKSTSNLPQPTSIRSKLTKLVKENNLSKAGALGAYYDQKVKAEGWKVGDLVYTRSPGNNQDHYGIYMGKRSGDHMFADFGTDNSDNPTGFVGLMGLGPSSVFRPVSYERVPNSSQPTRKYDDKEILFRIVKSMERRDLRYDRVNNNCEAWARMIVSGTPRSTQVERVSKLGQKLLGRLERVGEPDVGPRTTLKQQAKRLDLEWRAQVLDDQQAGEMLDVFDYLIKNKKRTDALDDVLGLMISPEELLPPTVTETEAVSRVKFYLMLLVRTAGAMQGSTKRVDFKEGKGKPCGESYIPKAHKCGKKKGGVSRETLAKAALAAGAVAAGAYAVKKSGVNQFHTGLGINDLSNPVRKRRLGWMEKHQKPMSSDDIANVFNGLEKQDGVIPENVKAFQDFIRANKITNNPSTMFAELETEQTKFYGGDKKAAREEIRGFKLLSRLGACDGLAGASNNIFVRSSRKGTDLKPDHAEMVRAGHLFMDRRKASPEPKIPLYGPNEKFKQVFNIARNTSNGDVTEAMIHIHEIAHKVHFKASGEKLKKYGIALDPSESDAEVYAALYKAASGYGRTDVGKRKLETFAELSVLYVTSGRRFKAEHPLAYDWVDTIWKAAK